MTTVPAAYAQFGYTLALAERTLTAVLREHLAERGTEPETWYALQLLAMRGPALDRTALSEELAGSRTLNPDSARELLARLEAAGLIRGGAHDQPDRGRASAAPQPQRVHRRAADPAAEPVQHRRHRHDGAHDAGHRRSGGRGNGRAVILRPGGAAELRCLVRPGGLGSAGRRPARRS